MGQVLQKPGTEAYCHMYCHYLVSGDQSLSLRTTMQLVLNCSLWMHRWYAVYKGLLDCCQLPHRNPSLSAEYVAAKHQGRRSVRRMVATTLHSLRKCTMSLPDNWAAETSAVTWCTGPGIHSERAQGRADQRCQDISWKFAWILLWWSIRLWSAQKVRARTIPSQFVDIINLLVECVNRGRLIFHVWLQEIWTVDMNIGKRWRVRVLDKTIEAMHNDSGENRFEKVNNRRARLCLQRPTRLHLLAKSFFRIPTTLYLLLNKPANLMINSR